MTGTLIAWRPRIGHVAYIGEVIVKEDGGPVQFIVTSTRKGTKFNTLAGPGVSVEAVVHLAFPDDPTKEVFAASVTKLAPVA